MLDNRSKVLGVDWNAALSEADMLRSFWGDAGSSLSPMNFPLRGRERNRAHHSVLKTLSMGRYARTYLGRSWQ